MIELVDVQVSFGDRLALDAGTLSFSGGFTVALMGPNGSGKTTLLRVLAGLQPPTIGRIEQAPAFVAYVGQHQRQHPWMPLTTGEVLNIGRYRDRGLLGRLRSSDRSLTADSAARLEVTDLVDRPFGTLSGGQRQRVLVAAALANDAPCLLLDEPITGLDLPSQHLIVEVIDAERDRGRLIVLSTHHLDEALRCDRVLLLNTAVVADGAPENTLTDTNLAAAFGPRVLPSGMVIDEHGHGAH